MKQQVLLNEQFLDALHQYRVGLIPFETGLTEEQEQAYVEQARNGEQEARQVLLLSVLPRVFHLASRIAFLAHHSDVLDLCQEASLAMLERFEVALATSSPVAYLYGIARRCILNYINWKGDDLIKKPYHKHEACGGERIPVVSLDAPLEAGSMRTWADVLEIETVLPSSHQGSFEALYEAVEQLPKKQRYVIEHLYGLNGEGRSTLKEIEYVLTGRQDRKSRTVDNAYHKALENLRKRLASSSAA